MPARKEQSRPQRITLAVFRAGVKCFAAQHDAALILRSPLPMLLCLRDFRHRQECLCHRASGEVCTDEFQVYVGELAGDPIGVLEFSLRTTVGQGQAFHAGSMGSHNAEGCVLDG